MKNKDTLLLEEAYELIQFKRILLSEGYSPEEIEYLIEEYLIEEWKWVDWLKTGLVAATLATTGLNAKASQQVSQEDMTSAANRLPGQVIRVDNTPASEINKKLDAERRSSARRSGVTAYDIGTMEFNKPNSTGYQPRDVRDNNRIKDAGVNQLKDHNVQMDLDILDYASEEFWQHVDEILDLLDRQAENDNSYAKTATVNLQDIDKQLNTKGKLDDATTKTVLNKVQKDVGKAVELINKQNFKMDQKTPIINQQQLLTYVIFKDVGTGEARDSDTVGSSLKDYIIKITNIDTSKPDRKDKLGNDYWKTDREQFRDVKVGEK